MLVFARRWLYDHKFLIESERAFSTQITTALEQFEAQTAEAIATTVVGELLDKWRRTLSEFRPDGQIQQSWLWEAPAKHSTVRIAQVFERIDLLYSFDAHGDQPVGGRYSRLHGLCDVTRSLAGL